MVISMYWTARHLIVLHDVSLSQLPIFSKHLPVASLSRASKRFPFTFPKHPGFHVTVDLLLWLAVHTTGGITLDIAVRQAMPTFFYKPGVGGTYSKPDAGNVVMSICATFVVLAG